MTRKSPREIERGVADLEADDPGTLDAEDMWEWLREIGRRGAVVGRPTEYFPDGAEWSDELQENTTGQESHPELRHLTPPEIYALAYMDDETAKDVILALEESDDEAAKRWKREAVERHRGAAP